MVNEPSKQICWATRSDARAGQPLFMPMTESNSSKYTEEAQAALTETAQRLEAVLSELARRLRPFPSFLGMTSVQAMEVEPALAPARDLGCVVVDPEGQLCRFEIAAISGIAGITESDQVEEFQALDLAPVEYVVYAGAAIQILAEELRRRGG